MQLAHSHRNSCLVNGEDGGLYIHPAAFILDFLLTARKVTGRLADNPLLIFLTADYLGLSLWFLQITGVRNHLTVCVCVCLLRDHPSLHPNDHL